MSLDPFTLEWSRSDNAGFLRFAQEDGEEKKQQLHF